MSRAESVHPRLRGELKKLRLRAAATNGSSPLTRGTRRDEYPVLGHLRFIPAYAGNSLLGFYRRSGRTVHPRLRGELDSADESCIPIGGSSPLTRGTQSWKFHQAEKTRFIPAYAGNSHQSVALMLRPAGSSPLTRGTPPQSNLSAFGVRFIPAYAGNSLKMVTTLH